MHFTEYDTRLAAYGLLTTEDGKILLTWFNGNARATRCWTMPGGGVEFDESIRDAVAREVFEETGYLVDVGHVIAEHHFTVPCTAERRPFRSQRFLPLPPSPGVSWGRPRGTARQTSPSGFRLSRSSSWSREPTSSTLP